MRARRTSAAMATTAATRTAAATAIHAVTYVAPSAGSAVRAMTPTTAHRIAIGAEQNARVRSAATSANAVASGAGHGERVPSTGTTPLTARRRRRGDSPRERRVERRRWRPRHSAGRVRFVADALVEPVRPAADGEQSTRGSSPVREGGHRSR